MKSSYSTRGIIFAVFAITPFVLMFGIAQGSPLALPAPNPAAQLWACVNGPTGSNSCDALHANNTNHGWDKDGNLAAGNDSRYVEGNTVPWRIEMDELDPSSTYVITFSYSFVQGHAYTWDYMNIWTATVGANGPNYPCLGLAAPLGSASCASSNPAADSSFPIPQDPKLHDKTTGPNCPAAPPGNPNFDPSPDPPLPPNYMLGYGPITITDMSYVLPSPSCDIASANNDQLVTLSFSTGAANNTGTSPPSVNLALVYGLHTSRPGDWGPYPCTSGGGGTCQTASSLGSGGTASSYHSNLVAWRKTSVTPSVDPGGLNQQQRQMKIFAVTGVTSVQLSKFGVLQVLPAQVMLSWTTGSEVDSAGFNIFRAESSNGPYTRVNLQLIPSSSDKVAGGTYQYQDQTVQSGKTYYYQLEDVELDGTTKRHDPIPVSVPAESLISINSILIGLVLGGCALLAGAMLLGQKKQSVS